MRVKIDSGARNKGEAKMTTQTEITMNPITSGMFCWNELATRDSKLSSKFYCELFGWCTEEDSCGDMPYTLFKKDGHPVGGMMEMGDNYPEETPSHWGSYVAVDDVDAMATRVTELGGTLCCGPQDAGDEGRFAVLTDPTGAVLSIFKGGDGMNPCGQGAFCWNELFTTDMDSAGDFYANLFGWTAEASEISSEPYTVFKNGEEWAGGMMKMHWEGNPSWLGYVSVENVDLTASKAIELGATLCVEPADIPGIGRFSVLTDPAGATVAVFKASSECCGDS